MKKIILCISFSCVSLSLFSQSKQSYANGISFYSTGSDIFSKDELKIQYLENKDTFYFEGNSFTPPVDATNIINNTCEFSAKENLKIQLFFSGYVGGAVLLSNENKCIHNFLKSSTSAPMQKTNEGFVLKFKSLDDKDKKQIQYALKQMFPNAEITVKE